MEYFYIIEHIATRKRYAGSRYAKSADISEFFNEHHKRPYYTSSKIVKSIIKHEGLSSFKILKLKEIYNSRIYEAKFLSKIDAKNNPHWLNQSNGSNNFRFKGGKRLSDEHKNNISKGNLGRIHSDETKHKIRLGNIGKTMSDESRVKMSKAWETRVVSEDTKLKMSKAKMGAGNNRYGAVVSEETREKIKLGNMGKTRTIESRLKQSLTNKGKPKPKTLCQHCNRFISNNVFGRFHGDKCKSITL